VPEPAKESRMRSPGLVANVNIRSIRRSGFGVAKFCSCEINSANSPVASRVVPTSLPNQILSGILPSCSDRYIFLRTRVSLSTNNISPDSTF